jgi:hypothetical protein
MAGKRHQNGGKCIKLAEKDIKMVSMAVRVRGIVFNSGINPRMFES